MNNDFKIGEDIIEVSAKTPQEFVSYIKQNPNRTQIGVVFCTSNYTVKNDLEFPCSSFDHIRGYEDLLKGKRMIFYNILYNWTLFYRSPYLQGGIGGGYPKDWMLTSFKLNIDNGILDYFSKSSD